jgi:hypothetical protein
MLDINGNVRGETQYGTRLGQQAEPVIFIGEWEAMAPLDIFEADGRALEMVIDVYETKEERGERVIAEALPPRQQNNDEGRRLMECLVDAIDTVREKYAGLTWVEKDPNTNVIRRFWTVQDGLYAGWGNMDHGRGEREG